MALHAWRSRDDLTLDEVIEVADALLREVKQTRYAVNERPDVRTVRYYTTRGLLPKPLSYDGGRARYGYGHLVRLLLIKRMQAEHFTLDQIARALANKSDDDVAALVDRGAADVVAPSRRFDEVPAPRAERRSVLDEVPAARASSAARAPAPRAPAATPEGDDLTLELSPGGKLIVDAGVVGDAAKRAQLAANLEQLARMLRAMGGGDDDE